MNLGTLRDILRGAFGQRSRRSFLKAFRSASFSQYGEDLFSTRLIDLPNRGFYVDVGAAHPVTNSNTYRFYIKGWRGITVEPNPEFVSLHRRLRPRDSFCHSGVGSRQEELTYYRFDTPEYNTFDSVRADYVARNNAKLIDRKSVQLDNLNQILERLNCPNQIDIMSIDCEGMDLEIVRSFRWRAYSVKLLMVEDHAENLDVAIKSDMSTYLKDNGFSFVSRLGPTSIFVS
jgi:FkbM family methyltransferase